jgi:hydroxyacid-oxoacid transhydrogenase
MQRDSAFQLLASNIRFGLEVRSEVGMDLLEMGVARTLLLIDPALVCLPTGEAVTASLKAAGIGFEVFDRISIEPTDGSFREAAEVADQGQFDSFVAVKMLLRFVSFVGGGCFGDENAQGRLGDAYGYEL